MYSDSRRLMLKNTFRCVSLLYNLEKMSHNCTYTPPHADEADEPERSKILTQSGNPSTWFGTDEVNSPDHSQIYDAMWRMWFKKPHQLFFKTHILSIYLSKLQLIINASTHCAQLKLSLQAQHTLLAENTNPFTHLTLTPWSPTTEVFKIMV